TRARMPLSAPNLANDSLVQELGRWRRVAAGAVALLVLLVFGAFFLGRAATRLTLHSGNVLWMASNSQEAVWSAEAAVRSLYLAPAEDGTTRQRAVALIDSTRYLIRSLRDSVSDNVEQTARVDQILARFDTWERVFAAPAMAGNV